MGHQLVSLEKKNEVDFDSYEANSKQAIPPALTMESITLGEQKKRKSTSHFW